MSAKVLTVTFDTNTLNSVVSPENAQRGTTESGASVRAALQAGRILGVFSETLVTLEAIPRKDRADVLGKSRLVSHKLPEGSDVERIYSFINTPPQEDIRSKERVENALKLNMRPLFSPMHLGKPHWTRNDCPLYTPENPVDLLLCMQKMERLVGEIAQRGVGKAIADAVAINLGNFDPVVVRQMSEPERWELIHQGLGRAQSKAERKRVAEAVAEWADGDAVAAHYGFGIDLFCSEDFASQSGKSVLDHAHREWLSEKFEVQFVSLAELAARVS
jgi:hypothetical protein